MRAVRKGQSVFGNYYDYRVLNEGCVHATQKINSSVMCQNRR